MELGMNLEDEFDKFQDAGTFGYVCRDASGCRFRVHRERCWFCEHLPFAQKIRYHVGVARGVPFPLL